MFDLLQAATSLRDTLRESKQFSCLENKTTKITPYRKQYPEAEIRH